MASNPYFLQMQSVLTANGTGTLSFTVPNNEEYEFGDWVFSSTGVFGITSIRVTGGDTLTNAANNTYIPNTHVPMAVAKTNNVNFMRETLKLKGGQTLYIDLLDTSGAGNTVKCTMSGTRNK